MSIWNEFAKLVGVAPRHAEDALHSERAAKATLSRRGMFGASAALAAGVAFGFPEIQVPRQMFLTSTFNWYSAGDLAGLLVPQGWTRSTIKVKIEQALILGHGNAP